MPTRDETIRYLLSIKEDLIGRREQLDKQVECLNGTIALLQATTQTAPTNFVSSVDFPIAKLRNMTQKEAVVAIAKHFGGTVKAQDAKRLMIRAGIMRDTKNSTNITHNVFLRSELFDRVRPGEYRLRGISTDQDRHLIFDSPVQ